MVRVAALMLVAAAGWAQQTLEITSALYGADNTWLDVSARLRSLVRNNTLEIRVDIATMGEDPLPGLGKTCKIKYRLGGREMETSGTDFETIRIPDSGPPAQSYGLRIISARYVAGDKFGDVAQRLSAMIKDDRLSVKADNQAMGSDPAVGKTKYLEVKYEYGGITYDARVKEGATMTIPSAQAIAAAPKPPVVSPPPAPVSPPSPSPRADEPGNLRIFYARYGFAGKEIDVRERLRPHVQADRLTIKVDNDTMGSDPARGADKQLDVIYEWKGRTFEKIAREGQQLTLP